MDVFLNNRLLFRLQETNTHCLNEQIKTRLNLSPDEFYLLSNGKKLSNELSPSHNGRVHIILRLAGGKGGFGSMLRAIGAQIEKTTNREACRDLSGRRLRDINEEQRLKNWIATQAEREKEAALRKKKKLEKLCEQPKFEFKDENYEMERSLLPEIVEDAVIKGLQASCSSSSGNSSNGDSTKRKLAETSAHPITKKKKKLWIDDEISSDEDECSDEEEDGSKVQQKVSKDINESEKQENKQQTNLEVLKSENSTEENSPEQAEEVTTKQKEETINSETLTLEDSTREHRTSDDDSGKIINK